MTSGLLLQAAVSGILLGGVYGLVASGLTLIFGVLRIINFAHGAVMMLAMYASYWLFVLYGVDPYASVLITAPLFFAIGAGIEKASRHANSSILPPMIAMRPDSSATAMKRPGDARPSLP